MSREKQFVVFDVAGEFAHFRRPYAITSALTFPLPPRTALCGLVGAILGLPKNDCLTDFADSKAIFGIRLLETLQTANFSINLIDTKDNRTFRLKSENPRTAMRYELIREPRYRVMFGHDELAPRLAESLSRGESVYTPCLGLAWLIAWFNGNPETIAGAEVSTPATVSCNTLVRRGDVAGDVAWDDKGVYQRIRMPAEMQPDRLVTRYEEYIIETTGRAITAELRQHWELVNGARFCAM